jgi:hypothetical protein
VGGLVSSTPIRKFDVANGVAPWKIGAPGRQVQTVFSAMTGRLESAGGKVIFNE